LITRTASCSRQLP